MILVSLLRQRSKTTKVALFFIKHEYVKKNLALKTVAVQCVTVVAYFSFSVILTAYYNDL